MRSRDPLSAPYNKKEEILKAIIETIIVEMTKGNFSFAILVIGILQLLVMVRKR